MVESNQNEQQVDKELEKAVRELRREDKRFRTDVSRWLTKILRHKADKTHGVDIRSDGYVAIS